MSAHADFAATVTDLLQQALHGPVQCRRMFGGYGFYHDQRFFAVMIGGVFHLKTSDVTRAAFEAAGQQAWVYHREGKPVTMGFHTVPEAALDEPEELRVWARLALQAANPPRVSKPGAATTTTATAGRPRKKREAP